MSKEFLNYVLAPIKELMTRNNNLKSFDVHFKKENLHHDIKVNKRNSTNKKNHKIIIFNKIDYRLKNNKFSSNISETKNDFLRKPSSNLNKIEGQNRPYFKQSTFNKILKKILQRSFLKYNRFGSDKGQFSYSHLSELKKQLSRNDFNVNNSNFSSYLIIRQY